MAKNTGWGHETVPLHELSHRSVTGSDDMLPSSIDMMEKSAANPDTTASDNELNMAVEIYARLNVLRFLLKEEGIYDAATSDFTEENFEKMQENRKIMGDNNVEDLLNTYDEDDIIEIMNDIAGLPVMDISADKA